MTLPLDILETLKRVDVDLARAIVAVVEKTRGRRNPHDKAPLRNVELAFLTPREALILVNPALVRRLPGVSVLPIDNRRAFLALKRDQGLADLEVAVRDRLDLRQAGDDAVLVALKNQLRAWRSDSRLRFESRAIIVATHPRRRLSRARALDERYTERRRRLLHLQAT